MILKDGTIPGAAGFLGLGTNFTNPQSMFHMNNITGNVALMPTYMQVTNNNTGSAVANDGFRFGIAANGTGEIREEENNLPIQFWLNATPFFGGPITAERVRMTAMPYQISLT